MPTLDWLNRDAAFKTLDEVPYRLLEFVSEHNAQNSYEHQEPSPELNGRSSNKNAIKKKSENSSQAQLNWASSDKANTEKPLKPTEGNLLIQGDNLEALKALLPFYRGQVKCIFIDPPYNTKSAFEHYDDNLEHAQWLSMMLPRLQLLRELLREDGSIWVTIDDNEGHYLKVLMDEVFGRGNFVANIFWQKTHTRENRTDISAVHDHLLVWAKHAGGWKEIRNMLPSSDEQLDRFTNPDNDRRGVWASLPAHAKAEKGRRQEQFFTITTPSGRKIDPPPGRCWLYTVSRFHDLVADKRIWFGERGDNAPRVKKFLTEVQAGLVPSTLWLHNEVGSNGRAKSELVELFPNEVPFSTPKPEALLQRAIHIGSNPNDLILDSFLGSGTTAAVAQKMNRRWIGIEMGEQAVTHCVPRLQKVIDGEQGGISKAVNWQGGGSFRFMKLGATIFDETGAINPEVRFATLAAFIWMQETGAPWRGVAPPPSRGRLGGGWFSGAGARGENHPHPNPPLEGEGAESAPLEGEGAKSAPLEGEGAESAPLEGEGAKSAPLEGERAAHAAIPFLGTHNGVDYFLLFNGILGDKRPQAGNVLTSAVLQDLNERFPREGRSRMIYGEATRLGELRLANERITFRQLPYDVGTR